MIQEELTQGGQAEQVFEEFVCGFGQWVVLSGFRKKYVEQVFGMVDPGVYFFMGLRRNGCSVLFAFCVCWGSFNLVAFQKPEELRLGECPRGQSTLISLEPKQQLRNLDKIAQLCRDNGLGSGESFADENCSTSLCA